MRLNAIILVLALVMGFSFAVACGGGGGRLINTPGTHTLSSDISGDCVYIGVDAVELDCNGHTINCDGGPSAGIYVTNGERSNIEIHDCIVENCQFGVMAWHVENFLFYDNTLDGNGIGFFDSSWSTIINGTIEDNVFRDNAGPGLQLAHVNNTVIRNNEVYENCWDYGDGALAIYQAENTTIEGNDAYDNNCTGILVGSAEHGSANVSISENTVYDNDGKGIRAYDIESSEINDNEVYSNGEEGIFVDHALEVTIDPNIVHDNAYAGIFVGDSDSVYTLDNVVYGNCIGIPGDCGGIFYDHVISSTIEGNEVYGHEYLYPAVFAGIVLSPIIGVYVYDNNVHDNMYGIFERSSPGLTIEDCNVHDNAFAGIYLMDGVSNEVIGCTVDGNGFEEAEYSSGLYADGEEGLYVANSDFDNNFHGLALIDSEGFLEDLLISSSHIHGIAMEDESHFDFEDLTLVDNWAAIGLEGMSVLGGEESEGLSIYGDTEFYIALMDDSCVGAWDIWLGFDERYGIWYEGTGGCDVWIIDGENILLRRDFVSLEDDDWLEEFGGPDLITTWVPGCIGLEHYYDEGFPESRAEILDDGDTFEPDYSKCAGTRATYTPLDGFTGYAATGIAPPKKDSKDPDYECTKDSDCAECEYCSIANNACLPVSEPCGEEEPECTSDSDCPVGFLCENEACAEKEPEPAPEGGEGTEPECTKDADCAAGLVCVMQECVQPEPECTKDADCAAGLACVAQKCVEKEPEGPTKDDAQKALEEAREAIGKAKSEGKDTSEAEALIKEAEAALANGGYPEAIDLAEKAKLAAQNAAAPPEEEEVIPISSETLPVEKPPVQPEEGFPWLFVIGGIVILGIAAWWFLFRGK